MTEPVTKEHLREFRDDIMSHISEQIKPVRQDVDDHDVILRGKSKRNGLVGDVRDIKAGTRVVKWFAGLGGLGGLSAWFKSMWI